MAEQKETIRGVPETMLQTLYARAKETRTGRGLISDPQAVRIVEHLNYDFSNADRDKAMYTGVVARTVLLDQMTEQWLKQHTGAAVINLACGLDTRCYRMEGLYDRWYNLDLPETMAIRRRFFTETDRIGQISCSAMDRSWPSQIQASQGPVLVIAEGLTMYLSLEDVQTIFSILDSAFSKMTFFIETMSPWVVNHIKEKSIEGSAAEFTWGIKNGKELELLVPPFRSIRDRSLTEGMASFIPIYRILNHIGFVRNISNKLLIMEK